MRKISVLAAAAALFATPAAAAVTLQINSDGKLTGATGVNVDGTLYDVTFIHAACADGTAFNGCDATTDFAFQTEVGALLAAQALLDQVFTGNFDSQPNLTFGCTYAFGCQVRIPYAVSLTIDSAPGVPYFYNVLTSNGAVEADDYVGAGGAYPITNNFALSTVNVLGRFTLSQTAPVPEPATWAMMLLGFGGIGYSMRRSRKALVTA